MGFSDTGRSLWLLLMAFVVVLLSGAQHTLTPQDRELAQGLMTGSLLLLFLVLFLEWAERATLRTLAKHLAAFSALALITFWLL